MNNLLFYAIIVIFLYIIISRILENNIDQENFDPSLVPVSSIVTLAKIAQKLVNGNGTLTNPGNLQIGAGNGNNGNLTVTGNSKLNGSLTVNSGMSVWNGKTVLASSVEGEPTKFNDNGINSINGNTRINASTIIKNDLTINGVTTIDNSLNVNKLIETTQMNTTHITTSENATINGGTIFMGSTNIPITASDIFSNNNANNGVTINKTVSFGSKDGDGYIIGPNKTNTPSSGKLYLTAGKDLSISTNGQTYIKKNSNTNGNLTVNGLLTVNGFKNLSIKNPIILGSPYSKRKSDGTIGEWDGYGEIRYNSVGSISYPSLPEYIIIPPEKKQENNVIFLVSMSITGSWNGGNETHTVGNISLCINDEAVVVIPIASKINKPKTGYGFCILNSRLRSPAPWYQAEISEDRISIRLTNYTNAVMGGNAWLYCKAISQITFTPIY